MTLYRRHNIWWAYVWIDGVRHQKSTRTTNRRNATRIGAAFQEELNLQRHHLSELKSEMTVQELSCRFVKEGLAKPYARDRLKHLIKHFGSMTLKEIDRVAVRRYRQERHAISKVKVATVNRDVSVLRRLMYFATEKGYIIANPLARMRMEPEPRTKRPLMSMKEDISLLTAASDHLRPIILCALDTGMRRGEILAQLWEDIDFDNRILYVSHSKTPEGQMREIPLSDRLHERLYAIRKEEGSVFTFQGRPVNEIKRTWATALREAEIRRFRFHDLRHTANTRLMLAGVMQEVRRELIGHTSQHSRDVNDRYTHIELPVKREAIRKLELWHQAEVVRLGATDCGRTNAPEQNREAADYTMTLLRAALFAHYELLLGLDSYGTSLIL